MKIEAYYSFTDNGDEIWAYEIGISLGYKDGKEIKKYECGLYNKTKGEFTGYCPEEYKDKVKKYFKSLKK